MKLSLEEIADSANFEPHSLVEPNSWVGHLPYANWIIKQTKPEILVELGTHTGNSYFAFCEAIRNSDQVTKTFAIDTWKGDKHAGYYDEDVFDYVSSINIRYNGFSTLLRCSFDDALDKFKNGSINLLHIDGLHTYKAVSNDFFGWLPKMAENGIVLLHDTNVLERDFGVHKLFKELSLQFETMNFLHSHGLGVIKISNKSPNIIPTSANETEMLMKVFAGLGKKFQERLEHEKLVFELRASVEHANAELISAEELVADYKNSRTWKITEPIRSLINRLKAGVSTKP
jgi:hypothetical protein